MKDPITGIPQSQILKAISACFLFVFSTLLGVGQAPYTPPDFAGEDYSNSIVFYENNGQLLDNVGAVRPDLKYYTHQTFPEIYFSDTRVSFVRNKVDTAVVVPDTLQRIDLTFGGEVAMLNSVLKSVSKVSHVKNFYLPHTGSAGVTNVEGFQRIVYKEIYDDVDFHVYSNVQMVKTAFVVHPGGDPNDIKMEFTGHDQIDIDQYGNLQMELEQDRWVFPQAVAYEVNSTGQIITLAWVPVYLNQGGGQVAIQTGSYNSANKLVIQMGALKAMQQNVDGEPEWSTYIGGSGNDVGHSIVVDDLGNQYGAGQTSSSPNGISVFPITTGAFQDTLTGLDDGWVAKFNTDYGIEWMTYWGGSDRDWLNDITYNEFNDKVYVVGRSYSDDLYLGGSVAGFVDTAVSFWANKGIIGRMNPSNGHFDWGTGFGGRASECHGIDDDEEGNIYVVGHTGAQVSNLGCAAPGNPEHFPACDAGNGYFQSLNVTNQTPLFTDAFIAEFGPDGALLHSTLYGAEDADWFLDVALDTDRGCVYAVGSTESESGSILLDTGGYFQDTANRQGPIWEDGLIVQFDLGLERHWATLFGGQKRDFISGVGVLSNGDIVVTGATQTATAGNNPCSEPNNGGLPVCQTGNAYTQNFGGGNSDGFVARFDLNHALSWSSFLGGNRAEIVTGEWPDIEVNEADKFFVAQTSGSNSIGFLQGHTGWYNQNENKDSDLAGMANVTDVLIAGFDSNNELQYGTYFGGVGFGNSTVDGTRYGDMVGKLAASGSDQLFMIGTTFSWSDFPLKCPDTLLSYCSGPDPTVDSLRRSDAFVAQLNAKGWVLGVSGPLVAQDMQLVMFPNPATASVSILLDGIEEGSGMLRVMDGAGRVVREHKVQKVENRSALNINLENLTSGFYIVVFDVGGRTFTGKIIKH